MQLYSINTQGTYKPKRIISLENYKVFDCGGSNGITLKHRRNGKELFLATKEFFEHCMYEYEKLKPSIGVTFTYLKDENGNKLRDKKGKPLRQFITKEEIENYKKVALKYSYIEYDDFYYLVNIYRTNNEYV